MRSLRSLLTVLAFAAALGLCAPASAWGPVAQLSLVRAGAHLLSQDGSIPLIKLERYVRDGAQISEERLLELNPLFEIDAVGAIQREMFLLQAVRGDRVDPYYAYRLGILGKMVAKNTAPMVHGERTLRARYLADVERAIDGVSLAGAPRKVVDPRAYFALVTRQAWSDDETISIDYRTGIGFRGFSKAALSQDASLSVNAVADVWYTIFSTSVAFYDTSQTDMREYLLGGMEYYLGRGSLREAEDTFARAESLDLVDPDFRKRLADAYYDGGVPARAVTEYQRVLKAVPGRRDVMERLSAYYVEVGENELAAGRLHVAREAFAMAAQSDSLHPMAQRKLLQVEARIFARDGRLESQQISKEAARDYEVQAEDAVMRRNYARAIGLLREAEDEYMKVTDEFPVEAKSARIGLKNVRLRMQEVKGELIENAQSLSGSGYSAQARHTGRNSADGSEQALREMMRLEYEAAVQGLRAEMSDRLP